MQTKFNLATVSTAGGPQAAIGVQNHYFILSDLSSSFHNTDLYDLFQNWEVEFPQLCSLASQITTSAMSSNTGIKYAEATLLTPIRKPDKLLAVGANYSGHLAEMGLPVEKWESMPFFMRPPSTSLVGPGETVQIPRSTKQFDWECELAIIVGKRLRHATASEAEKAIAGYSIGLDLSCRDLIRVPNELKIDLIRGKAQDTMAPCGPHIVPAAFVGDVNNLRIKLAVNGKQMMDASTNEMLYKCDEILSIISEYLTLMPGDIVFTGSPSGSAGVHGNCWLQPGDVISAAIQDIGELVVKTRSS